MGELRETNRKYKERGGPQGGIRVLGPMWVSVLFPPIPLQVRSEKKSVISGGPLLVPTVEGHHLTLTKGTDRQDRYSSPVFEHSGHKIKYQIYLSIPSGNAQLSKSALGLF